MTRRRTLQSAGTAPPLFTRLLAAGCAALIVALSVLAVSPTLHDWLHGHDSPTNDQCAVVAFAGGIVLAAAAVAVAAPRIGWCERARVFPRTFFLVTPRYLRQPERGPPAC